MDGSKTGAEWLTAEVWLEPGVSLAELVDKLNNCEAVVRHPTVLDNAGNELAQIEFNAPDPEDSNADLCQHRYQDADKPLDQERPGVLAQLEDVCARWINADNPGGYDELRAAVALLNWNVCRVVRGVGVFFDRHQGGGDLGAAKMG